MSWRSEKSEVQNFPDHTPEPDFSAVMLTVWWLSSFILISTLNGYFDNQDRDFLTGKLQLTEEFLKTETFRNKTDIKSLSEKINDAMVGHNGLFISIKNMENEKIVELYAKNSVVPAVLLNKSGDILDYMIQTEENNTVYRSISRRVAVTPEQGKSKHVIITVATDTGYHTLFMDKLSTWLFWFNIGLVFISVFLGWLTTRIGLKPLREMTSLASSMTVHSLDQRLNPDLAPPKISETMQEFNNMFDRLEGHSGNCQISRLTSRMSCAHQSVI
jgi:two-component system heavy metal sensor histidine kinase CusS